MKRICFIIPFFGKLPDYFSVWLKSCEYNPTIDFNLYTNDRTRFNYPSNVHVSYMNFSEMQNSLRSNYDFEIAIATPYKLCDYKVAYGEIFAKDLEGYDYWGYCDIDLIWGDIRSFYTEELLTMYDKIGCQGHATIFRNNKKINSIYKNRHTDNRYYKDIFRKDNVCATDVNFIKNRFEAAGLKQYTETIYAGLMIMKPGFYLQAMPSELSYQNKHQVFLWENGHLYRCFLDNGRVETKEYLYIHFFKRPMKNHITVWDRILIYPDVYKNYYDSIDMKCLLRYGHKSYFMFIIRMIMQNKHRLTFSNAVSFIKKLFQ